MNQPSATKVQRLFSRRGWTLATAESCTGGLLGKLITDQPGSSGFYRGGVIVYSNESKIRLLGVRQKTLAEKGAVSLEVARAMARGVRNKFRSTFGAAVTGIAGPGGGCTGKPVGLVYISLAGPGEETAEKHLFSGTRREIRLQAARRVLDLLTAAAESLAAGRDGRHHEEIG